VSTAALDLSPAAVRAELHTRRLGRQYVFLPSCDSTNDKVVALAADGAAEGLLVAADGQTQGRGRRGRLWHSPAGENLYFSLLLRPTLPTSRMAPLTLLAGAALAEAMAALAFSPRLKWPNDVLLDTGNGLRKVAGILAEMAGAGERVRHVVLGVGCNVNTRVFPDSLTPIATSLHLASGKQLHRGRLLAGFLDAFEPIYEDFLAAGPEAGLERWRRHALLGQPCRVEREATSVAGIACGVDATGALLLHVATGETIPVSAGEVIWR
jgi:BirA family biotin operon repressor/biotin-[acetyl-CoA-carboxylase] ligase